MREGATGVLQVEHARVDFMGGRGKGGLGLPWREQQASVSDPGGVETPAWRAHYNLTSDRSAEPCLAATALSHPATGPCAMRDRAKAQAGAERLPTSKQQGLPSGSPSSSYRRGGKRMTSPRMVFMASTPNRISPGGLPRLPAGTA